MRSTPTGNNSISQKKKYIENMQISVLWTQILHSNGFRSQMVASFESKIMIIKVSFRVARWSVVKVFLQWYLSGAKQCLGHTQIGLVRLIGSSLGS